MTLTYGQRRLAQILPPDIYQPGQVIDKGTIRDMFGQLAKEYPDEYKRISNEATVFGREVGKLAGGGTFSISHLATPKGAERRRDVLRRDIARILQTKQGPDQEKAIIDLLAKAQATDKDETVAEITSENNPLAMILRGAGRGNPAAISRLVSSDLMYADQSGKPIPIPVLNSYSKGLTSGEYIASMFGVRSGMVTAKTGIGMGGYAAKLLQGAAHRMVVTGEDAPEALQAVAAQRGLPVDTSDKDNIGALLAKDTGPYKRNQRLDAKILAHLQKLGHDEIIVRSPITSSDPDGGVYARDIGYQEKDQLPGIGESVGITAANALCLHVDTLVVMADGTVKRIQDIVSGDVVMGSDRHGRLTPTQVIASASSGDKECFDTTYEVTTYGGFETVTMRSSKDHKILSHVHTKSTTGEYDDPRFSDIRSEYTKEKLPAHHAIDDDTVEVYVQIDSDCVEKAIPGCLARRTGSESVGVMPTWDIYVDHPDHLFVLANGLIVSNSEPVSQSLLCLAEGTMVRMADGSEEPIEEIRVGDKVMGADRLGNVTPTVVVATYDNGLRECQHVKFASSSKSSFIELVATGEHKVLQAKTYEDVATYYESKRPFTLTTLDSKQFDYAVVAPMSELRHSPYPVKKYGSKSVGKRPTYDIEVAHPDHLFVLSNGLIVSNSAKHKGGLAEAQSDDISGFELIDRLINTPRDFREASTHTEVDGRVTNIRNAEQGGQYITVSGKDYYVQPNRKPAVSIGDTVEAGDQLTDGVANPRMVVKYKGIGEGARQLTHSLRKAIGGGANRRNVELIARGLVDRVQMTDVYEDYLPDDIVPYNEIAARWQPRAGSREETPELASGMYLEQPVLHYSIGTRITPSVRSMLQKHKVERVVTHDTPPPFEPELVRATDLLRTDSDWMTRQIGTGLQKGLLESAHRGRVSDEDSTSFVPARARAVDYGQVGKVRLQPPPSPTKLPDLGHL